LTELWGSIAAD